MTSFQVQVVLELDSHTLAISGPLVHPEYGSRPFCGWMQLVTLIDEIASDHHPRNAPDRPSP